MSKNLAHPLGVLLDPCAHRVHYPDPERLIFIQKIGFFMVVVDAGQLVSCWLTIGCPLFEKFLFQNFLSFYETVHPVG